MIVQPEKCRAPDLEIVIGAQVASWIDVDTDVFKSPPITSTSPTGPSSHEHSSRATRRPVASTHRCVVRPTRAPRLLYSIELFIATRVSCFSLR